MTVPPGGYAPPGYGQPPGYPPPYGYYPPPAPKPGCVPLRPLGVGEILDGSFQVIRRNPKATLGVAVVIAVIQAFFTGLLQLVSLTQLDDAQQRIDNGQSVDASTTLGGTLTTLISTLVIAAVLGAFLTGMLTIVITQDVLGVRLTISQVWQRLRGRLPRLLGLSLITGLVPTFGLVLLIVPGVFLWGIWAVAVPAFIVEETGIRNALGRSRRLVSGTFWRVWGIRALGALIVLVITGVADVPFQLIASAVTGQGVFSTSGVGTPYLYVLISSIGAVLTVTATAPIRAGIDALLYVDLRMRKEGLDIALQQAIGAHPAQQWTPQPPTSHH